MCDGTDGTNKQMTRCLKKEGSKVSRRQFENVYGEIERCEQSADVAFRATSPARAAMSLLVLSVPTNDQTWQRHMSSTSKSIDWNQIDTACLHVVFSSNRLRRDFH